MTDWRKLHDEGSCPDGRGCNACRNCMCALADDVIAINAELVEALEEFYIHFSGSNDFRIDSAVARKARAALAKAKG